MALFIALLLGFLSIMLPGFFLALALLRKTELPMFEIAAIGFIFGMVFPPTLVWLESYMIPYVHFFSFSAELYNLNVIILTVIGIVLSAWQGAFSFGEFSRLTKNQRKATDISKIIDADYKKRISELRATIANLSVDTELMKRHEKEEQELIRRHKDELDLLDNVGQEEKRKIEEAHLQQERKLFEQHEAEERLLLRGGGAKPAGLQIKPLWALLFLLMVVAFLTRIANIGIAPKYFEFDPYFDTISTEYILVHGYQIVGDHSAWPTEVNGSPHILEPLMPYLEAYWYDISATPHSPANLSAVNSTNVFAPSAKSVDISLLSTTSSVYPPIAAALLVFVVFMFLYHEYGEMPAMIGAVLATAMPALITTFIAGEQLVEPWGIMIMFFFYAAYLLAVNNPEEKRFALLAGIAFSANFLGAHYYIVPAAIFALYVILQGVINLLRNENQRSFYISNAIILAVIILFYIPYGPYNSSLTNRVPLLLGVPLIIIMPLGALAFIFISDYAIKMLYDGKHGSSSVSGKGTSPALYKLGIMAALAAVVVVVLLLTPLGKPFAKYIQLSVHFTTPSIPLFMTVQEYAPTGFLTYNFGNGGFGVIGSSIGGISVLVWAVIIIFTVIEFFAIYKRNSKSSILAISAIIPLAMAGMSEVKYLPHFGVGYIIAICAIIGELTILLDVGKPEKETLFLYGYIGVLLAASALVGALQVPLLLTIDIIAIMILLPLIGAGVYYYIEGKHGHQPLQSIAAAVIASALISTAILFFATAYSVMTITIIVIAGIAMLYQYLSERSGNRLYFAFLYLFVLLIIASELIPSMSLVVQAAVNQNCSQISTYNNAIGAGMFCNQVPQYWLEATAWMRNYVGPYAPRILSWWDYGDWINWFGNSNAVLRGDNSVASYDYTTAAHFVLSHSDGFNASSLASFMKTSNTKYVLFDDQLVPKWGALDFLGCIAVNRTSMSQAQQQGLGLSACELSHDPLFLLIPVTPTINDYCQYSNSTNVAVRGLGLVGNGQSNVTYCVSQDFLNGVISSANPPAGRLYTANGTKTNAYLVPYYYTGTYSINGNPYAAFLVVYAPNGPNNTITDAPTQFYNSTFYRGFFLGRLDGFSLAYPNNFTGLNFVNSTHKIVILQINNYSAGLPPVTPKPALASNNYTMPG